MIRHRLVKTISKKNKVRGQITQGKWLLVKVPNQFNEGSKVFLTNIAGTEYSSRKKNNLNPMSSFLPQKQIQDGS